MKERTILFIFLLLVIIGSGISIYTQEEEDASPRSFDSDGQFAEYLDYILYDYIYCESSMAGDVNSDRSIDIIDALLVARYYVGLLSASDLFCGDVNSDSAVDIIDALLIAQFYVGLIPDGFFNPPIPEPVNEPSDYSETNIQEAGVDEADIVKTDGSYIYTLANNNLIICRSYPPNQAEVINTLTFEQTELIPADLFLMDTILVVIGTSTFTRDIPEGIYNVPVRSYTYTMTKAIIYDITDRQNLSVVRTVEIDGAYLTSRRIGNILYLLASRRLFEYGKYPYPELESPIYTDSAISDAFISLDYSRIEYFPFMAKADFLTVSALDLTDTILPMNVTSYITPSREVYVSQENMYVAYYNGSNRTVFMGWFPMIPANHKCYIFKIKLDGMDFIAGNVGSVPGRILNRFSMSEYNGYFRIATSQRPVNNVYVLDEEMVTVGSLEGLAPGESIYSARFMGNRGYVVTFRIIDPLFVINLEDPENPHVLGELKIPGYSNYLHPYGENHLIGIGKDTAGGTEVFSWFQGIKLAIFDVTDVTNPIELHKEVIGHRGSDSIALRDPKSFLFSMGKNLFVIPVSVHEFEDEPPYPSAYAPLTFEGVYVYDLSLENGFQLQGMISHNDPDPDNENEYILQGRTINRSLYIENDLYTLSDTRMLINDLNTLDLLNQIIY